MDLKTIAFDADDTLWHNERHYRSTEQEFAALLSQYHSAEWVEERLLETEMKNLRHFGYGVKSFMLSMIETAVELTEGRVSGTEVARIIAMGKEMLETPVELLPGVRDTIHQLTDYRLVLITKGDLFDQESKLARSGLGDFFDDVRVVTEKSPDTYRRILDESELDPVEFLMVGNSVKSDILPVVSLGGNAIHVPHDQTWVAEQVADEDITHDFITVESIERVPDVVQHLESN